MKIKSVQLKNFKRFTDLRIENIPEETKLVLLIGTNGSGKSSVFDGFRYSTFVANSSAKNDAYLLKPETTKEYYRKQVDVTTEIGRAHV